MPDLKKYYDRYLLAALGLVVAVVSVLLALASGSAKETAVLPPRLPKGEPFSADAAVDILKADSTAMAVTQTWRENTNGASPFVSRVYLLKDDRLVDIFEEASDLFPGIPNSWVREYNLDYLDTSLPERDPDADGFTNFEEFTAKTNPRDAASRPEAWTKLRLTGMKREMLEVVFTTPIFARAEGVRPAKTDKGISLDLAVAGTYNDPPKDEKDQEHANPPSFKNGELQVRVGSEFVGKAKVKGEIIKQAERKFRLNLLLTVTPENAGAHDLLEKHLKDLGGKEAVEVLVGGLFNSQSADTPGRVTGQSAEYVVGQTLYVNKFVPGRTRPQPTDSSFKLVQVKGERRDAPSLGAGAKKDFYAAEIQSGSTTTNLEQGRMAQSPFSIVTLTDTRPGGRTFEVRSGETFTLGDSDKYKLVDVSEEKATIESLATKEQHSVPKGAPAATDPIPTTPEKQSE